MNQKKFSSESMKDRTFGPFLYKWRWKSELSTESSSIDVRCHRDKSIYAMLIICVIIFVSMIPGMESHPVISSQSDCDWNGRGSLASSSRSIQTISLRCTRGIIHWEDPKGGLRVQINPNLKPPYKLCLEDDRKKGSSHRILLEEHSGRLLQILSTEMKNSDCYEILEPSAILYVESHGGGGGGGMSQTNQVMSTESSPIHIAYEVESLRDDGDPCRPCSETEVLKSYCSSDVVARGSILQIIPGKSYDWIYIKSDLVLHQNQPVFTKYIPPMINFLKKIPNRFDLDKPQRLTQMTKRGEIYEGIISHPASCSASVGEGDFLWLIKFRFGIPMTDCVIYWDKWVDIGRRSEGECPLFTG